MLNVQCPECGKSLKLVPSMAGRKVECPGCRAVVTCPTPSSPAQSALAPFVPAPFVPAPFVPAKSVPAPFAPELSPPTAAEVLPSSAPRAPSPSIVRTSEAGFAGALSAPLSAGGPPPTVQINYPTAQTRDSVCADDASTKLVQTAGFDAGFSPVSGPATEEAEWYTVLESGKQVGPISWQRLETWWREGILSRDCQVYKTGWSTWKWADEAFSAESSDSGSNILGGNDSPASEVAPLASATGPLSGAGEDRSIQLSRQELPGLRLAIHRIERWGFSAAWTRALVLGMVALGAAAGLLQGFTGKPLLDRTLAGGALCVVGLEFVGLLAALRWHQHLPRVRRNPTAPQLAKSLGLASSMLAAVTMVHAGLLLVLSLAAVIYYSYQQGIIR